MQTMTTMRTHYTPLVQWVVRVNGFSAAGKTGGYFFRFKYVRDDDDEYDLRALKIFFIISREKNDRAKRVFRKDHILVVWLQVYMHK